LTKCTHQLNKSSEKDKKMAMELRHGLDNGELHANTFGDLVPFSELSVGDIHYLGGHQGDEIDCDACAENHTESVIDGSYVSDEWVTHSKFDADEKLIPSDEGTINCPMCEHWIG
jgi:hypothetical protein